MTESATQLPKWVPKKHREAVEYAAREGSGEYIVELRDGWSWSGEGHVRGEDHPFHFPWTLIVKDDSENGDLGRIKPLKTDT